MPASDVKLIIRALLITQDVSEILLDLLFST
jgi:hypothetical protein